MARRAATRSVVGRDELLEFVRPRNQWVLSTVRGDGRPQVSPVTGGVGADGTLLISSYPMRDKIHNLRRNPLATVCVLSDHFGGAWVQVDGRASITDMPESLDGLIEYYRAVSGDHPNWDEYRDAMVRQGKCLISIEIERWGPVATGGFPAPVIPLLGDD
jgi:PPOX class probable F420-dependent enzyme